MSDATLRLIDGRAVVYVGGSSELLDIPVALAVAARAGAEAAATRAEGAAGAAQATARYFTTRAAGEAASTLNQAFATDDGAGSVIYYKRTAGGSAEIGRAVTPASLAAPDGAARVGFRSRSIADRLDDEVNVRDYIDMVVDGDWTAAIQAAIASIDNTGGRGGTVYMPTGVYRTTDTINVPDRIKFLGAASRASIINSEHDGSAVRFVGTDYAGLQKLRVTVASNSPTAVAIEIYSDVTWAQWNLFDDLEVVAAYAFTRGQKGIWCHSRDDSTTITYNHWNAIRIFGFHKPWVIDDYYEGNFHYHIHINGFGIDNGDEAIYHAGAANHWEAWFGKAASQAATLVGIRYLGRRTNNRFKVTCDIGPGKAMEVVGSIPTGGDQNMYEVSGTLGVTSLGDVINYAPFVTGTFSPQVSGTTSAGVPSKYNAQLGSYTRLGDRVSFDLLVDWEGHTGGGSIQITNLPAIAAGEEPRAVASAMVNGLTVSGAVSLLISGGSRAGVLYASGGGSIVPVGMSPAGVIRITGSYRVSI